MHETDYKSIEADIAQRGWAIIKQAYTQDLIEEIKQDLERQIPVYERIQKEEGVFEESRNAFHHSIVGCPAQMKLLAPNPIHGFLEHYFGGRYILNAMGTTCIYPSEAVYTQKIHRDSRSFSDGSRLILNTLIMLDDSTEENGATWMLEGSHKAAARPSDEEFYAQSIRACGKSGDLLLFDGNIWHSSGENKSDKVRRIITPLYSKPFVKQSLDYPRAFGMDYANKISPELKQILGYNALTPSCIQDFYKPRDKRFYKSDQG